MLKPLGIRSIMKLYAQVSISTKIISICMDESFNLTETVVFEKSAR